MNSSVSSAGINESVLAGMNSDVSVDFRKKKKGKNWFITFINIIIMERGKSFREAQGQVLREVMAEFDL